MMIPQLRRIRWMMVLIAIIPVTLVSLFFSIYMYQQRSSDAEANLISRGNDSVKYMASNAELAVFSGNEEALGQLASQVLQLPDVRHVAYFNSRRDILLDKGTAAPLSISDLFQCNASGVFYREDLWFFCEEIVAELPVIDDFGVGQQSLSSRIGWVSLALDTASLDIYRGEVLTASILAGTLLTFLGALLAAQFSFSLAMPIHALAQRVKHVDSSEPKPNLGRMPVEELEILGEAIENMLHDSAKSQELLRSQVDQATEELRKVNEDLQQRNVLLLGTQQKLEMAAKSKDMFLARVSHELRTPLTTVMGYAGLLKDMSHNNQEREYISNISVATKSLLYIIDDILTLSKVSEGKLVIDQRMHDLEEFIAALISQHAFRASDKGIELLVNIDREVPKKLFIDDQRLRQVLSNFISNSIKFTERGEISINVRLSTESNELCFTVRDSGMGISPDTIQKLFQPFTQADESISRRFGGSGLGLAISKQLAQLMNGRIELKSEVNEGTEAFLYISLDDESMANIDRSQPLNASILAFDESAVVRGSWRRLLVQKVSDVLLPATWEKAIGLLDDQAVDVVLYGVSGRSINSDSVRQKIEHIRAVHEGVIAISYPVGQLKDAAIEKLEGEFSDLQFLQKPLMPAMLNALFSNVDSRVEEVAISHEVLDGLQILLVEDQDIIRRFITLLLQNYGAEVSSFSHADEALAHYEDTVWDIVLSDLHMPDINGEDFYTRLSKRYEDGLAPFYIITADNAAKEHRRLEALGITGVISKPIIEQDFISTLSRHQTKRIAEQVGQRGLLQGLVNHAEVSAELKVLSEQLASCLAANDWQGVRETIHKIKGLAGVSQLPELVPLATALSEKAHRQDVVGIAQQLDQLFDYTSERLSHG